MKRVFSFLLVLVLVVGLMPVQAAAYDYDIIIDPYGDYAAVEHISHESAPAGTVVTITLKENVTLNSMMILQPDSTESELYTQNGRTITFTMPEDTVTIYIDAIAPHRVTNVITADHADPVIANNSSKTIEAMAGTTITIDPRPDEGYEFVNIKLEYADGTGDWLDDGVLSFKMPDIDLYVAVYYKACDTGNTDREYSVSVYTDENGQATPSKTSAKPGEEITVTCTPNTGYSLGTICSYANTASGMLDLPYQLTGNNQFTFNMPNAEAYIVVYFSEGNGGNGDEPQPPQEPTQYNVNVNTPDNGTVTATPTKAQAGTPITITTQADNGYELDTLTVKDASSNPVTVTDGQFTMPQSDVTVTATFKASGTGGNGGEPQPPQEPTQYFVDVRNAKNGSVSANPKRAEEGTTITLTATPDLGYELNTLEVRKVGTDTYLDVNVDGNQGQFTMPASDVMVTATFKRAENADGDETTYDIHLSYDNKCVDVTASATEAKAGETVTITTMPKKISGGGQYAVKSILLLKYDGNTFIQAIPLLTKSFIMPDYDVTVMVTTEVAQTHKITYQVVKGEGSRSIAASGLIQLDDGFGAKEGLEITIGATPADGYELEYIKVYKADTDELYISTKNGKFNMPNFDVNVDIAFKPIGNPSEPEKITVTFDPNGGSVTPDKAETSEGGKLSSIPAPVREGYTFQGWFTAQTGGEQVSADTVFTTNTTIYAHWEKTTNIIVEHITKPENNSYGADLDMTDKDVLDKFLGNTVASEDTRVWMTVEKINDVDDDEKKAIETLAASDKLATYLDIKMFKKVGANDPEMIHNTNGDVTITMTLDAGVVPSDAGSVYIIYYHGSAQTRSATYDHSTRKLTFQANEFSTYALAYKLKTSTSTSSSAGTLDNVPKTGGSDPLMGWTMLVLCSAAALAGMALFDKKRAR